MCNCICQKYRRNVFSSNQWLLKKVDQFGLPGVNLCMQVFRRAYWWLIGAILVCIVVITVRRLSFRSMPHKITAQELLREALRESPNHSYPETEIFEQQATQGYYDDALATARLATKPDDLHWFIIELAKIHVQNGDAQGAKDIARLFPDWQPQIFKAIALAQAHQGDLSGALATSHADANEILEEFADHQIKQADFPGALQTAERLPANSAGNLFYDIGDALRQRHEQKRVHELAAGMSDRKLAQLFLKLVPLTLWDRKPDYSIQLNACELAGIAAMDKKLAEARKMLEGTHCWYSFLAIQYYKIDPSEAEKLLRSSTDPKDLTFGLAELAMAAAKKGRIEDALRLDKDAKQINPLEGYSATLGIARAWTIRDGPEKVIGWARSLSVPWERKTALLGMAQALGHLRPGVDQALTYPRLPS
jgi:tetratricopeptide (TPR) repeat protein